MLGTLLIFGYGKTGVEAILQEIVNKESKAEWVLGLYYYEVLVRKEAPECCMLFCFHEEDDEEKLQDIRQSVESDFGLHCVREVCDIPFLQALRYVRLLYRLWEHSCLYAKYTHEALMHEMRGCGQKCLLLEKEVKAPIRGVFAGRRLAKAREELLMFQSLELMVALHGRVAQEMVAVYNEPSYCVRTRRRNSLASSTASSSRSRFGSLSVSSESQSECGSVGDGSESEFPAKVPVRDRLFMVGVSQGAIDTQHVSALLTRRRASRENVLEVVGGVSPSNLQGAAMGGGGRGSVHRQNLRFLAPPEDVCDVDTPPGMGAAVSSPTRKHLGTSPVAKKSASLSLSPLSRPREARSPDCVPRLRRSQSLRLPLQGYGVCDEDGKAAEVEAYTLSGGLQEFRRASTAYDGSSSFGWSDSTMTLESDTFQSAEAAIFARECESGEEALHTKERLFFLGCNFRRRSVVGGVVKRSSVNLLSADIPSI